MLFRGGPAIGPWQQIGAVAEITHPDADLTAAHSYTEFWSDPEDENMPASLWDVIVTDVAVEAERVGPPLDRPAFDRDAASVGFNSTGGTVSADFETRLLVASWSVMYLRADGIGVWVHWPYLITFEGTIVARGEPIEVAETDTTSGIEAADRATLAIQEWANPLIEDWEGPTSCLASCGYRLELGPQVVAANNPQGDCSTRVVDGADRSQQTYPDRQSAIGRNRPGEGLTGRLWRWDSGDGHDYSADTHGGAHPDNPAEHLYETKGDSILTLNETWQRTISAGADRVTTTTQEPYHVYEVRPCSSTAADPARVAAQPAAPAPLSDPDSEAGHPPRSRDRTATGACYMERLHLSRRRAPRADP